MLGPSGCGKTTTLRMIAGFEEPDAGRVLLDGEDVTFVSPQAAQRQHGLSGLRAVPAHDRRRERRLRPQAEEGRRGRSAARGSPRCSTWSGSTATRTAARPSSPAASASASRSPARSSTGPAALLLDEPLGALDLKLRREMQLELKRIQQSTGTTFVYVTHDQEEALTMSDRIAVMDGGVGRAGRRPAGAVRAARRPRSSPTSSAPRTCSAAPAPRAGGLAVMDSATACGSSPPIGGRRLPDHGAPGEDPDRRGARRRRLAGLPAPWWRASIWARSPRRCRAHASTRLRARRRSGIFSGAP